MRLAPNHLLSAALLLALCLLCVLPASAAETPAPQPGFDLLGRARVLGARDLAPGRQAQGRHSFMALFQAISRGDAASAAQLLPSTRRINDTDIKTGATPLTWAAQFGRADMVGLLLDRGADVEGVDGQKSTALVTAAKYGHVEVVRLLLLRGADANRATPLGLRPLLLACDKRGSLEAVQLLVEAGANPHLSDNNGWTPLAMAAKQGRGPTAVYLLKLGASPDGAPDAAYAPLHWAATENRMEMAALLLENGADVNRPGARGETPLSWCTSKRLKELLLQSGAVSAE